MNEFVNFGKRGVTLPAGCKDLGDVWKLPPRKAAAGEGFAHIERHLARLVQSPAKHSSLVICPAQDQEYLYVQKKTGGLRLLVTVNPHDAGREEAVLEHFREAGVAPAYDQRATDASFRLLIYPLTASVPDAADSIRDYLQKVCGIEPGARLYFCYAERGEPGAAGK